MPSQSHTTTMDVNSRIIPTKIYPKKDDTNKKRPVTIDITRYAIKPEIPSQMKPTYADVVRWNKSQLMAQMEMLQSDSGNEKANVNQNTQNQNKQNAFNLSRHQIAKNTIKSNLNGYNADNEEYFDDEYTDGYGSYLDRRMNDEIEPDWAPSDDSTIAFRLTNAVYGYDDLHY